jgi:hypothetical protein
MATPVEEFQTAVGVGDLERARGLLSGHAEVPPTLGKSNALSEIRKFVTVRVVRDLEVRDVRDLKSVMSVTGNRDLDL